MKDCLRPESAVPNGVAPGVTMLALDQVRRAHHDG